MPISAAAMSGIETHGHRWRYEINLRGQPERLGDEEALVVGDCLAIRDSILADLRKFLGRTFKAPDADLRAGIEAQLDDLEMAGDDIEELRAVLADLYDIFDFHRVCVIA